MTLEGRWLEQGFFELNAREERGHSFSQEIRKVLSERLGVAPMRLKSFPVGPVNRNTLWWRDGKPSYGEAQYFLRLDRDHPVLSFGVSVEKGFEEAGPSQKTSQRMDRASWDWSRVVPNALILTKELARINTQLGRPVFVWVGDRTFMTHDGKWLERNVGKASPEVIQEHLEALDRARTKWVNLYMGCDLVPREADGMTPAEVADLLMAFSAVRKRLRPR